MPARGACLPRALCVRGAMNVQQMSHWLVRTEGVRLTRRHRHARTRLRRSHVAVVAAAVCRPLRRRNEPGIRKHCIKSSWQSRRWCVRVAPARHALT